MYDVCKIYLQTNATGTVSSQPSQPAAEGQQPQTQVGEKVAVTTEQPTGLYVFLVP